MMRGMTGYQMKAAEVKAACGHVVKLYDLRHNPYRGWAPTAQRRMTATASSPCPSCIQPDEPDMPEPVYGPRVNAEDLGLLAY